MSARCEEFRRQTGDSRIGYFSSSQWLPARFASRNSPGCLHSTSRRDRYLHSMRIGALRVQRTPYCMHAPLYSLLLTVEIDLETSSNFHTSLSTSSLQLLAVF